MWSKIFPTDQRVGEVASQLARNISVPCGIDSSLVLSNDSRANEFGQFRDFSETLARSVLSHAAMTNDRFGMIIIENGESGNFRCIRV